MAKNRRIRQQKKIASRLAKLENTSKSSKKKKQIEKLENRLKNLQRVEPIPNVMSSEQLEKWKSRLEPMVTEANKRIELLKFNKLYSMALDRVKQESNGKEYFDIDEISNRNELIKEVTRMRVFLNDKGSTIDGAAVETAMASAEKYKGKFGNQYNNWENRYKRYSKELDDEVARRAFETYRKIESHRASLLQDSYGSENMITILYDAEYRGLDSLIYGEHLLDIEERKRNDFINEQEKQAEEVTAIGAIFIDNITGRSNF